MSILSDNAIEFARQAKSIVIEPYDPACLGGNSYDVHLSPHFGTYAEPLGPISALDARQHPTARFHQHGFGLNSYHLIDAKIEPTLHRFDIPDAGYMLIPGILYLGSTLEYTETHDHVPYLDGRSSTGRLGISIHATAGRGDVGFCNHWTLEITVVHPVVVYPGMRIGQLTYHTVKGEVGARYGNKAGANYNQRSPLPQPSRMYKSFLP